MSALSSDVLVCHSGYHREHLSIIYNGILGFQMQIFAASKSTKRFTFPDGITET